MLKNIVISPPSPSDRVDDHRIGGTDSVAIMGDSAHKNALDVYLAKNGISPQFGGNKATERGILAERIAIEALKQNIPKGYILIDDQSQTRAMCDESPHNQFMRGTPDAFLMQMSEEGEITRKLFLVSIKSCNSETQAKWAYGPPNSVITQELHYTALLADKYDVCGIIVVLANTSSDELQIFHHDIDHEDEMKINDIIHECKQFYNDIKLPMDAFVLKYQDSINEHNIKYIAAKDSKKSIVCDEVDEYIEVRDRFNEIQKELDTLKLSIKKQAAIQKSNNITNKDKTVSLYITKNGALRVSSTLDDTNEE